MDEKKTSNLLNILNSISTPSKLNTYINETIDDYKNIGFCNYFKDICIKKNIKKSDLINKSNLDRTYGYQILNGTKKPSRDKILQLCIASKLTLEETQKALTLGNAGNLYAKNSRDSIIIFALNNDLNVLKINDILFEFNLPTLGDDTI